MSHVKNGKFPSCPVAVFGANHPRVRWGPINLPTFSDNI